jgi:hypothetical protein
MKKLIVSAALAFSILTIGTTSHAATGNSTKELAPQEKIVKDFTAQFVSTPTVTFTDNGYIASSVVDGHQVSAAYNKKGSRVYSIVRYTSDNLAKNIVDIVKGTYDKYFITSMEKIEEPNLKPVFIVHLTNANSVKTVRVSEDGTELLQNFRKI